MVAEREAQTVEKAYRAARPFLTDADAAVVGPILEGLAEAGKGRPQDIVDAAAPAQSPLHRYFTWDDTEAARKCRLHEARGLARSFWVEIVEFERNERTVFTCPGLISIKVGGEPRYETVKQIRTNEDKMAQAFADAKRQIAHFRAVFSAYRHMGEFTRYEPLFQVLDSLDAEESVASQD